MADFRWHPGQLTENHALGSHVGKVAVITGAATGIGLATASLLSQQGARVIAVDIDGAALHRNCRHLSELQIVHDMAGKTTDLVAAIESFGEIPQILVNNVGIAANRAFLDLSEEGMEQSWRTNVLGPLSLTRSIVRALIDSDRDGSVLFVSSLHSTSVRRSLDYSMSKAAIAMAVRELAAELGPHRIRVNAVSPGDIHSDPIKNPLTDRVRRLREQVIPLDRLGTSSDIAQAILFLTNDAAASYITGADLVIDGGLSTTNWITTSSMRLSTLKEGIADVPPTPENQSRGARPFAKIRALFNSRRRSPSS